MRDIFLSWEMFFYNVNKLFFYAVGKFIDQVCFFVV